MRQGTSAREYRPSTVIPYRGRKGLSSIFRFFIFGELMIKIVLGYIRVRLSGCGLGLGADKSRTMNLG